jgi:hypothetical protein
MWSIVMCLEYKTHFNIQALDMYVPRLVTMLLMKKKVCNVCPPIFKFIQLELWKMYYLTKKNQNDWQELMKAFVNFCVATNENWTHSWK